MNYSPFWDTWFSNPWLSFGIPAAIFIGCVFMNLQLSGKKNSKDTSRKRKRGFFTFLAIAFPICIMMVNGELKQSFFGYGNSKNIVELQYINGKLYAIDYLKTMGGKTSSGIKYYRIHIVDPATGKKERRFLVGAGAKLLRVTDKYAYIGHYSDLWIYDVNTGKRVSKYNEKTLPKLFPELAQGVDNMHVNDETLMITISCKDGRTRYLNPLSGQITEKDPNKNRTTYQPTNKLRLDGNEIKMDDSDYGSEYLDIEAKNDDGKRARIYNSNDEVLYKDLSFLNGRPVVINPVDSSFVVMHFENTENEQFILTCLKLDGSKMLWEIKQTSLNPTYRFKNYKESVSITDDGNGKMFFGIAGELFCVDLKDGKMLWKAQL